MLIAHFDRDSNMQRKALEKRLQAVLLDFQRLANSDPHQLRALIPATEVWRLFVEDYRQDQNYNLSYYLNTDNLDTGFSSATLNRSLEHFSNHYSGIDPSKWQMLVDELHLSPKALASIKLRDLINYNKGWFLFELGEPGYIKGLYRAFQCIFEEQDRLNLDFICKIHQVATAGVANTNHRLYNDSKHGGNIRTDPAVHFGLNSQNSSEQGIYEILEQQHDYAGFKFGSTTVNHMSLQLFKLLRESYRSTIEFRDFPNFAKKLFSASDNKQLAAALYWFIINEDKGIYFTSTQHGDVRKSLTDDATRYIDAYNDANDKYSTPLQIIDEIVDLIKSLEDLHIFEDANCRTICMILTNNRLLNSGLPFSFIRNANRFDAKSHDELLETIIEGMEDVFELIRTGSLHNVHTSNLIALSECPNTIGVTRKYFDEAVAIEERARRRLQPRLTAIKRQREEDEDTNEHAPKRMRKSSQ